MRNRDLRCAGSFGLLKNVALRYGEVDNGRGEFEILRAVRSALRRWLVPACRLLRQPCSIESVHCLKLVLASEIHDHAARFALHRLRSGLLDMNVAGHGRRAQQVLLTGEQELSLVGTAAHFRRLLLRSGIGGSGIICHRRLLASRPASRSQW